MMMAKPLPEDTTLEDVSQWLRDEFPSAVAVTLFVNYYEHEITMRRVAGERPNPSPSQSTMRRLDGHWARV
jgi:hypothetical protein